MVSGAEAADAAVKIARKWGIEVKHIPPQELLVLGCSENYHGLSSGIWPIMNPGCGQEGNVLPAFSNPWIVRLTTAPLRIRHLFLKCHERRSRNRPSTPIWKCRGLRGSHQSVTPPHCRCNHGANPRHSAVSLPPQCRPFLSRPSRNLTLNSSSPQHLCRRDPLRPFRPHPLQATQHPLHLRRSAHGLRQNGQIPMFRLARPRAQAGHDHPGQVHLRRRLPRRIHTGV